MKKFCLSLTLAALAALALFTFSSCTQKQECDEHVASEWTISVQPSCIKDGVSVRRCKKCGEITEFKTQKAEGHTPGKSLIVTEATCTQEGLEVLCCAVCNEQYERRKIEALGHTPAEFEVSVASTCKQAGEEVKKCKVCSEVLETKALDIIDHEADGWTELKAPSCVATGEKARICKYCNEHLEVETIPSSGHNAGSWVITKEPTCTETGIQQRKCIGCSSVMETQSVAAKGHTKGSWRITKEATCTETGTSQRKCTVCSEVIGTQTLEALGHTAGELVTKTEPTCTKEGEKQALCTVCNEVAKTESVPKIAHDFENDVCKLCSAERVSEGLELELVDNKYYVVGIGDCEDTRIIIPKTHEGAAVAGIADNAFAGNTDIVEVVMKDGLVYIGKSAFKDCAALEKVTLANDLEKISEKAFSGCTKLVFDELSLDCAVEKNAFDGVSFNKLTLSQKKIEGLEGVSVKTLTLDDGVEIIAGGALLRANIEKLVLPPTLKTVEDRGFYKSSVESVEFKSKVDIGECAFEECKTLKTVTIPTDSTLGAFAFKGCQELERINFGGTKEEFGQIVAEYGYDVEDLKDFEGVRIACADGDFEFTQQ